MIVQSHVEKTKIEPFYIVLTQKRQLRIGRIERRFPMIDRVVFTVRYNSFDSGRIHRIALFLRMGLSVTATDHNQHGQY